MLLTLLQLPIGFFVALSGALIPGPLLTYVVAKSSVSGKRVGPYAVLGHALVEIALLLLLVLGLSVLFQNLVFQTTLGISGGILLIILGVISARNITKRIELKKLAITSYRPVAGGVLFSTVFNPTVIIWWTAIGFAMLMEAYLVASFAGVAFWLIGHFLADLGWFSFVSFSVAKGRKFIGTKGHRTLLTVCSLILLVLGSYLVLKYGLAIF